VEKPAVEPPEVVYGMLLAWEVCKAGWSNAVAEMRGDYFRQISPLYETLVNEELAALNKLLTKRLACCAPYYAFKNVGPEKVEEAERLQRGQVTERDIRNFVAHAGLLDAAVKICPGERGPTLAYTIDIDLILNHEAVKNYI